MSNSHNLLLRLRATAESNWPGLAVAAVIAAASIFVAEHYGGPTLLYALLIGMALHFLSEDDRTRVGIETSARTLLRLGVALLGVRIGVEQIAELGAGPVALVIIGVVATILFGVGLARLLGLGNARGVLTGGATAICGASAALAISAVLPRTPERERDTLFAVVAVTSLSTLAMIGYPILVDALGLAGVEAGVFLGGTIHDVAQVVGAGYIVSVETGDAATLTKLFRVALLAPVVLAIAWAFRKSARAEGGGASLLPPWFLVAFVLLATANSVGVIPPFVATTLSDLSRWLLIMAIAAIGVKTSLGELRHVGWRALALMVAETVFLALLVLIGLQFL